MVDPVKSEAVRIYTSRGRTPMPTANPDGVTRMRVPDPAALLAYVESVVDEMFNAYPLNWTEDVELSEMMRLVAAGMGQRHPELDSESASALAWMWGYSAWK